MIDCYLPFSTYNSKYTAVPTPQNIKTAPNTTINQNIPSIAPIIPARTAYVDNFQITNSLLIQPDPSDTTRARRIASTTNPNNVAKIKHTLANLLTTTLALILFLSCTVSMYSILIFLLESLCHIASK